MNRIADVENVVCSVATMSRHPELYHYTPAPDRILGSQQLWCSHYREMLDEDEVTLMRSLLPAAVAPLMDAIVAGMNRRIRRTWDVSGRGNRTARDLVDSLYSATFDGKAVYSAFDLYMFSFSTHADDADFDRENGIRSQWDGYAGPSGACLVFDIVEVARMLGKEMDARYWARLSLEEVRYADAPVEEIFPELVGGLADTLKHFIHGTPFPEVATVDFLRGTTLLKGAGYRLEREVRVVAIPGTAAAAVHARREYPDRFVDLPLPEIRTRPDPRKPGATKRYVALFDGLGLRLPLKRVVVAPGPAQEERAAALRALVGDVPVTLSKTP